MGTDSSMLLPEPVEMGRPGAAHGHGQAGRVEQRSGVPAHQLVQLRRGARRRQGVEHLLLLAAEELGEDPVDHHRRQLHRGLVLHPLGQLDGLVDRHLLGRAHGDQAGGRRIGEDVEHPVGLGADESHLDQVVDGLGGGQQADDVAGGRCVHHHQVVVALAHLVDGLAHGEDLPHPGRGGGHEVEGLGQRPDAADDRDAQLQLEVLAQRRLGVHGHGEQAGEDLLLVEAGGRGLVEAGHVALGIHLADEDPLARAGRRTGPGPRPPWSCRRHPCRSRRPA